MGLNIFELVITFLFLRRFKKTKSKLFCGICSVLILTINIILTICSPMICIVAPNIVKQVDEAESLCCKSHVLFFIVIIIAHMHD